MFFKGLFFIFKEIAKRVEEELTDEESVKRELVELYRMLETGRITEEEFEKREGELIERLEEIEEYKRRRVA